MKITTEITDYSNPAQMPIKIHNAFMHGQVELEVDEKRYTVDGDELISAVKRCMLDHFGK